MRAGSIRGVVLEAHPALPLFMAAMCAQGLGRTLAVGVVVLVLHELAHALAAHLLGMRVLSLELTPFGACAHLEGLREQVGARCALVALAGPAANALLAAAALACVGGGVLSRWEALRFVRLNLVLMGFNLLPALPLDGGRALMALLAPRLGAERCLHAFSAAGEMLGGLLLALSVWGATRGVLNLSLLLAASYLIYAAAKERSAPTADGVRAMLRHGQALAQRGALPVREMLVRADLPIAALARHTRPGAYCRLCVVDESLHPVGILTEDALLRALLEDPAQSACQALRKKTSKKSEKED